MFGSTAWRGFPMLCRIKRMKTLHTFLCLCLFGFAVFTRAQDAILPGTQPLTLKGDLSAQMVEGIDKFLLREIERSTSERPSLWKRDFSSREAYESSVGPNRERFRRFIGAVDGRLAVSELEYIETTLEPSLVAETDSYTIRAVRWPVFDRVFG
jgi:hypothetical protein